MPRWTRILALAAAITIAGGNAHAGPCKVELTESQIAAIVEAYLQKTFGETTRWTKKDVNIRREGCNYVYVESSAEEEVSPGDFFGMTIDQDGKVIDFMPGL